MDAVAPFWFGDTVCDGFALFRNASCRLDKCHNEMVCSLLTSS
jgi:hypothetical protein